MASRTRRHIGLREPLAGGKRYSSAGHSTRRRVDPNGFDGAPRVAKRSSDERFDHRRPKQSWGLAENHNDDQEVS